jgi:hypothetical protein
LNHLHRSPIEVDNGKYSIEQPASWERSAKASLFHKFEHGTDDTTTLEHIRPIRSLSTSPPPPGAEMSGAGIDTHAAVASFFRQLNEESDRHAAIRKATPQTSDVTDSSNRQNIQQTGVSPDKSSMSPLDIVIDRQLAESNLTHAAMRFLEGDAEVRFSVFTFSYLFLKDIYTSTDHIVRSIDHRHRILMWTQNLMIFPLMTRLPIEVMDQIMNHSQQHVSLH